MHQCLKCKRLYENESVPVVEGCDCGSRLFLFIKSPADIVRAERYRKELEQKIEQIDREKKTAAVQVRKAKGQRPKAKSQKQKVRFGIETIKVLDIGIYEIHLEALMQGAPIIVLSKSGSYIISFPTLFGDKVEVPLK